MINQMFLSPQVKRCAIITYKHGRYELSNDLRLKDFRELENVRKVCKLHRIIAQCPVSPRKLKFC